MKDAKAYFRIKISKKTDGGDTITSSIGENPWRCQRSQ